MWRNAEWRDATRRKVFNQAAPGALQFFYVEVHTVQAASNSSPVLPGVRLR